MAIQIYKAGQGRYARIGTAIGMVLVDGILAYYVWLLLAGHLPKDLAYKMYVEYGVAAAVFVALAIVGAIYLNKPTFVDFLVATESEMKKVSWSSRAELFGSTAVVIATVFLLADFIFIFDYLITGGLAGGYDISWNKQEWMARVYTGVHVGLVLAGVAYYVKYRMEIREASGVRNPGLVYGVPAVVFIGLGALWCYGWFVAGIHFRGLGLW